MILSSLYIDLTGSMGRGVFTSENISKGVIVEESPVIVMTNDERKLLDQTLLHDYIFEWGEEKDQCCMALGYVPAPQSIFRGIRAGGTLQVIADGGC